MKKFISTIICIVLVCALLISCTPQTEQTSSQQAPPSVAPAESAAPSEPTDAAGESQATVEAAAESAGNEGVEVIPEGEKLENLEGKTIAACVLLEDQFQRMLQITMKKTAEEYGAKVLEGHSGGELDKEVELVNTLIRPEAWTAYVFSRSA